MGDVIIHNNNLRIGNWSIAIDIWSLFQGRESLISFSFFFVLIDGRMKRTLLDPSDDRVLRQLSRSKRRVRAQNNIDFFASSTSIDSNSSSAKTSMGRKTRVIQRGSSPVCNIILTIQSASSDDSTSDVQYFIQQFDLHLAQMGRIYLTGCRRSYISE